MSNNLKCQMCGTTHKPRFEDLCPECKEEWEADQLENMDPMEGCDVPDDEYGPGILYSDLIDMDEFDLPASPKVSFEPPADDEEPF